MDRYAGIFFGALVLGISAIVVVAMQRNSPEDPAIALKRSEVSVMRLYPVPAERGETIRDSLRTVLLANLDRGVPLGNASLPTATQLVVLAPASMQPSIADTVSKLSEGAALVADAPPRSRSARLELWVAEVLADSGDDDPALKEVKTVLDAARDQFGAVHFRLQDRVLALSAIDRGSVEMRSARLQSSTRLRGDGTGVLADVEVQLIGRTDGSSVHTQAALRFGQWTLLAIVSGKALQDIDRPDRILLIRATEVDDGEDAPAAEVPARSPRASGHSVAGMLKAEPSRRCESWAKACRNAVVGQNAQRFRHLGFDSSFTLLGDESESRRNRCAFRNTALVGCVARRDQLA